MKEIQQLRCIALKLGVSGTALPITETRLYKGSYGFVKLQVYAPKTQNTEAPVCTAFCTTTDELGREKVSSRNHNLIYVGEFDLEGKAYLLFESLLPKEFTQKETSPNGLKITFNYFDTAVTTDERGEIVLNESGVPKRHATDLLVSSTYTTTVYPGGWNEEDIELNINSAEVGQIVANMNDIAEIQTQMDYIKAIADGTHADSSEALETAKEAKKTADGLKDEIDKANQTAQEAVETANSAVNDIEQYKGETNSNIMQFTQTVEDDVNQFKSTINDNVTALEEDINSTIGDVNNFKSNVAQVISNFETGVNTKLDKFEEQLADTGTIVKVDGVSQKELSFDSDPQGQFNALNANDEELQSQITELGIVDESLQEQANALADGKVSKLGDTMSGNLKIEKPSGGVRTEWVAGNDEHISWGINSDDQSYGLYDWKRGKWILQFKQDGQLYIAASIMNGILGLSNGQQARGYKQVVGGTDLSTEQSGFFSNGYCNYSKYVVAGDGGDKIAIGYEYGYDNPGFNFKVYNSGKLEKDAKILYLETSKLEPTTANGWTIGGNDLIIASDGVYLVSVTNSSSSDMATYGSSPSIMIVRGATILGYTNYSGITLVRGNSSTAGTNQLVYYNHIAGRSANWNALSITGNSMPTEATIGQVAYKKIA